MTSSNLNKNGWVVPVIVASVSFAVTLSITGIILACMLWKKKMALYKEKINSKVAFIRARNRMMREEQQAARRDSYWRMPESPAAVHLRHLEAGIQSGVYDDAIEMNNLDNQGRTDIPSSRELLAQGMPRWWRWSGITVAGSDQGSLVNSASQMGTTEYPQSTQIPNANEFVDIDLN